LDWSIFQPEMRPYKLFLGGACGANDWRSEFTQELLKEGVPESCIFNPVVPEGTWCEEDREREENAKSCATHMLYYLADPQQVDNRLPEYSMVEACYDLQHKPERTVVVFDDRGLTGHDLKDFKAVRQLFRARFPGAPLFDSKEEAVEWLSDRLTQVYTPYEREWIPSFF